MWSIALGAWIGLLLAIHGFAHWQVTTLWGSRPEASSWLLGAGAAGLGNALWILTLLTFVAAGVGVAFHLGWWRPVAISASIASLVVLLLFWDMRIGIGAAVDIGVLVGLLWLRWPSSNLVVMSTHALRWPAQANVASVADDVLRCGHRPVLMVRREPPAGETGPMAGRMASASKSA